MLNLTISSQTEIKKLTKSYTETNYIFKVQKYIFMPKLFLTY